MERWIRDEVGLLPRGNLLPFAGEYAYVGAMGVSWIEIADQGGNGFIRVEDITARQVAPGPSLDRRSAPSGKIRW